MNRQDALWAAQVKARDSFQCRRCGVGFVPGLAVGLDAHHIFTRSRQSTRHDLENGVALCWQCHGWAHRNPLEFHRWIEEQLGADVYDALQARSRRLVRT